MDLVQNSGTKTILGLLMAVISYIWGQVTTLIIVLAMFMVLDYLTGIVAGMFTKEGAFDREKAVRGFVKKVMYGVLLAAAFLADYVIFTSIKSFGADLGITMAISFAVTLYLIGTEGFSIMQNLILIGVPAPPFMQKIFGLMKDNAGKLIKIPTRQGATDGE